MRQRSARRMAMMIREMSLLVLLLSLRAATAAGQKPSTVGFISIDCGLEGETSYRDADNDLLYSSDSPYTSTGINQKVSPDTNITTFKRFYATVRSFPDGVRNCYTLAPVLRGAKYRVTGEFFYGNYDGLNRSPTFDLYLDVNLWTTVQAGSFTRKEIITVAAADSIQVCLVDTGKGRPFISELDLRPLPFTAYDLVNDSSSSILFNTDRKNYGAQRQIKFPDDIYDRGWYPASIGITINTTEKVSLLLGDRFPVPQAVLQTASMAKSLSEYFEIATPVSAGQDTFVYMYFTDLQRLASNETREFSVYGDNRLFYSSYRPAFLSDGVLYTLPPGKPGGMNYSIRATVNSTLPPIINAIEIFSLIKMPRVPTIGSDVQAIGDLKKLLQGSRNWEGDPCVPREFMWQGLGCSYGASNYSQITSLDLSRSGLSGRIPPSIANLTSLTSLDLSYNNLTGEVPSYLGDLPALKSLNLAGNNLSGTIPKTVLDKAKNGSLKLRIDSNPILCSTTDLCSATTEKKKGYVVPVAIGVSLAVFLPIAVIITLLTVRRKTMPNEQTGNRVDSYISGQHRNGTPELMSAERGLNPESNQFSKADIENITGNFKRPIGQGGFGTVFHGVLIDGTEVAVKILSKASVHAERQFRAEAELLTRVHHRYLVSLLGYCNESKALVYEFVPQGSLADHLSGNLAENNHLTWNIRLRIALEAAQGLDYLHNGCEPPIVHRDVKPSNFLLTEKFEVKIADFGLSRTFGDGRTTFSTTIIAGTPGYLDPEYQQTYKLSYESDVYSFGVVLLELVTGKPPIIYGSSVTHISKEVRTKMESGDLTAIADPRLQGNYDVNSMWRVLEIALLCSSMNSSERPTMGDAAAQLKECLAAETSREFPSRMGGETLSVYADYSVASARPAAR